MLSKQPIKMLKLMPYFLKRIGPSLKLRFKCYVWKCSLCDVIMLEGMLIRRRWSKPKQKESTIFEFIKWPNPILFFVYFRPFQTSIMIFTTNQCEKMFKCPSSTRHRDSNPQPYVPDSSPITTRPGLLPRESTIFELKKKL